MIKFAISAVVCLVCFICAVLTSLPAKQEPPVKEETNWLDTLLGGPTTRALEREKAKKDRPMLALLLWIVTVMTGLLAVFLGIGLFSE